MGPGDFAFALPLIVLAVAAARTLGAARRAPAQRAIWLAFAAMCALAALASAAALTAELGRTSATPIFHFAAAASCLMALGTLAFARHALAGARLDGVLEALVFVVIASALSLYFVIVPGVRDGDAVLTAVFLVDLLALGVAGICAIAGGREHHRVGWALTAGAAAVVAGDGLVSAAAAGQLPELTELTAVLWAVAGAAFAWAAAAAARPATPVPLDAPPKRFMTTRLLLPFAAVVAVPEIAVVLWATGSLSVLAGTFFGSVFVLVLLLVFARQAYLLLDNRRAIARERGLSDQMVSRNRDLEALTGLATTMTQSLEEEPIVERGLSVLMLGSRAASAALHVPGSDGPRLAAVSGAWSDEDAWAAARLEPPEGGPTVQERGARLILQLPLAARGSAIGTVTLMRSAADALEEEELGRLEVLANQLAIAIQNARDYRDQLEQAIRDPLTGVYNRRFFFEALEKEVRRCERYGSPVSLVVFDIDDFKAINDTLGHARGDDALRAVTEIAQGQIREVDSFARLGGEEFGLLLPETGRLDALLVADRVRTAVGRQRVLEGARVTLSGGVASCPQDADSSEELERRADAALYWSKRNGKNICAVASEVTDASGDEVEADTTPAHLVALVSTLDAEPLHTRDHSENVAAYAAALGQALGLGDERVVRLRRAAFFHDVGKIAVPHETLAKPGRLDDAEWAQIRVHPCAGASILAHAGLVEEARLVGQHHEQVGGGGYPRGLKGEEIALEARIILVADAFEAMTSDRPYRDGMPVQSAVAELRRCTGSQFDPRVVAELVGLVERGELAVLALRGQV